MSNMKMVTFILTVILSKQVCAGIPVIDASSIAQSAMLVTEAKNQLTELKEQLSTAKNQLLDFQKEAEATKKRLEGYTDYSSIFGSADSFLKKNSDELMNSGVENLDGLRKKYDFESSSSTMQKKYDSLLQRINSMEVHNERLNKKSKEMNALHKQFSNATTPQEKADISNQLQTENINMQFIISQYDLEEKAIKNKDEINREISAKNFRNRLLK